VEAAKYCQYCGSQREEWAKFCPSCGASLEPEKAFNVEQNRQAGEKDTDNVTVKNNGQRNYGNVFMTVGCIFVIISVWLIPALCIPLFLLLVICIVVRYMVRLFRNM